MPHIRAKGRFRQPLGQILVAAVGVGSSIMRPRSSLVMIAACATLIGHAMAYAVHHGNGAAHPNHTAHGYVHLATLLLVPLALVAIVSIISRDGHGRPRPSDLMRWQLGLFAFQESAERAIVGGHPASVLADPVVWVGAAAQVAVALAICGSIRLSVKLLRNLPAVKVMAAGIMAPRSALLPAESLADPVPVMVSAGGPRSPPGG